MIALVAVISLAGYLAVAYSVRSRALRARGPTVRRGGGWTASAPYFVWVPYAVLAVHPGPEIAFPDLVRALGLALVAAGPAFAAWSALVLGRHLDVEVEVHADHEVVRRGPYALVRHPIYLGLLVHYLGACLATGNLLFVVGTALVTIPTFVARARAEEALLRAHLGEAYDAYAREVPMLVPLVRI